MSSAYERVYAIVARIPKGKVLTYGLISNMLEGALSAQGVGWALKALASNKSNGKKYTTANVPWHRVINSAGRLSTHKNPDIPQDLQKTLLEAEGVIFEDGAIDLKDYLWVKGLGES